MEHSNRKRAAEILEKSQDRDLFSRSIDLLLEILILLNVIAIALESVPEYLLRYKSEFFYFEAFSVAVFTVEYLTRVWSCIELDEVEENHPLVSRLRYMCRPLLLIDLIAIIPFYLLFFFNTDLRFLRVIRLLRIFKLTRYWGAMNTLLNVLREEASALGAAAFIMFILLVLASSGIYLIEQDVQPEAFGSIPSAMWWSIVTLTTVGYGDVTPVTTMGKLFGATISLVGVGMVALPTGILASGFANAFRRNRVSYEQEMDLALKDGQLTPNEIDSLERIKDDLGISEEDAAHILHLAINRLRSEQKECPHCSLDRKTH